MLPAIDSILSAELSKPNKLYIEPFVGGGAVLFNVLQKYKSKVIINDVNSDLINAYITIRDNIKPLLVELHRLEDGYYAVSGNAAQLKQFYCYNRQLFNTRNAGAVLQAALFIFLNKTCYNGLYRVNKSGGFNVPIGRYKKPKICDEDNLLLANKLLKDVIILNKDFDCLREYITNNVVLYIDPPYIPVNNRSFTSYTADNFTISDHKRLREFCIYAANMGARFILSNSDTATTRELFSNFNISAVKVSRNINSDKTKRKAVSELLITNIDNK